MSAAAIELRGRAAAGKLESSPEARTRDPLPFRVSVYEGESFFFLFLVRRAGKIQKASRVGGRDYVTGNELHDGSAWLLLTASDFCYKVRVYNEPLPVHEH